MGSFSGEYRYFDAGGLSVAGAGSPINYHMAMVYGARTDADDLPAGSATYAGRMISDNYALDDPDTRTGRSRLWGDVRLDVDFAAGTLEGKIVRLRHRPPGGRTSNMPHTAYMDISGGTIVDGQFTAEWAAVNLPSNASGDILGEFYGPTGEELGGVFNGTDDDEVYRGWFGTTRYELDPHVLSGTLSEPLTVAVDRDYPSRTATEETGTSVTAIESDGANGFNVTYTVEGQQATVHLGPDDVNFVPAGPGVLYSAIQGGIGYTLDDAAGSLTGSPEFSHFNVHGWSVSLFSSDGTGTRSVKRGFLTYGVATEVSDMPTGTADYSGRVAGSHMGWARLPVRQGDLHGRFEPERGFRCRHRRRFGNRDSLPGAGPAQRQPARRVVQLRQRRRFRQRIQRRTGGPPGTRADATRVARTVSSTDRPRPRSAACSRAPIPAKARCCMAGSAARSSRPAVPK